MGSGPGRTWRTGAGTKYLNDVIIIIINISYPSDVINIALLMIAVVSLLMLD
jgi:hypothetical protein